MSLDTARRAPVATAPPRAGGLRRTSAALAMILAPWGFVITNTAYMLAIRDGGNEDTSANQLALWAAHPQLAHLAVVAGMVGSLLVVPAVMGFLRLASTSRLVTIGGSMMAAGYVCYFGVLAGGFTTLAMAQADSPPRAELAPILDASFGDVWAVWIFPLFVLGNIVGTAVLAAGLLRSRVVPVWAALGILSWPVLHVIGLVFFGNEVPQVIGAVLQATGFAASAVALLRTRP